jgi:WD40 repeat protein
LRTVKGKNAYYSRMAFSPDGKMLAESAYSSTWLWNAATGEKLANLEFNDSDKARGVTNNNFAFAPDGKTIVVGLGDCLVFWDLITRKEVKRLEASRSGIWHGSDWIVFSDDGKYLASTTGGKITVWDLVSSKQLQEFPSHFSWADSVAVSPGGKYVASASGGDRTVRLWDAHTGKPLHVWLTPHRRIYPVLFTPDSASVIAAAHSVPGGCRLWDVVSGKERRMFDFPDLPKDAAEMLTSLRLSPDGKRLIALSLRSETKDHKTHVRKRYLTTWDVLSGERIQRRQLSFDNRILMNTEKLSPDGKYATVFHPPSVIIYDVLTDRPLRSLTAAELSPLAFSSDNKLLAYSEQSVGKMQRLRIHEIASGTDVLILDTGQVWSRDFTPDGRFLLTSGDEGLRLWELASGKEVLRYAHVTYFVSCVAIASDGRSAATGILDTNILVWDLAPATREKNNLSVVDLDRLWRQLASDDASSAYRAAGAFIADPERALPFLAQRLQPVKQDAPRIRRLIADLDSEKFAVRDAAFQELEKMDDAAHAVLRQELQKAASLEMRRRIQSLLSVPWVVRSPEKLRQIRAVMVLEQIGTAEARRVLERLAGGASEARQTREAKAALQRLHAAKLQHE